MDPCVTFAFPFVPHFHLFSNIYFYHSDKKTVSFSFLCFLNRDDPTAIVFLTVFHIRFIFSFLPGLRGKAEALCRDTLANPLWVVMGWGAGRGTSDAKDLLMPLGYQVDITLHNTSWSWEEMQTVGSSAVRTGSSRPLAHVSINGK